MLDMQQATSADAWKGIFGQWPDAVPKAGAVVTSFGETIPFKGFLVHDGMIIVERPQPDSIGARTVMIPYENIVGIKITNPLPLPAFQPFGFRAQL